MDNFFCKECNKEFDSERSLHAHLKFHKISLQDYYIKHYFRADRYDNKPIAFKDKEQYLESDFNSKENMKSWFKSVSIETSSNYAKNLLIKRKSEKNLIYSPTQVELRSLISPSIITYNNLFGDYYKLCNELGLINKHKNSYLGLPACEDITIVIDTRENCPLKFNYPIEVATLNFGDYCSGDLESSANIYVERKSPNDFISTLGFGYERFKREIERAAESKAYLIIMVEESLDKMLEFTKLGILPKQAKVKESFIFHNVRELCQTYSNIQFVFAKNRDNAASLIEKILTTGETVKNVDLQLQIDLNRF